MCQDILFVTEQLKDIFGAEKIYVFGVKYDCEDTPCVTDFDVCVVADIDEYDKTPLLKKAYLQIDCDIPFDIFLYGVDDFRRLAEDSASFVSRILRKGKLYYEKKQ